MARQTKINNYILCDLLVAILSWILFFGFRKLEEGFSFSNILASMYSDSNFWKGLLLYPGFWFCLHYISGYYRQIYRKSRTEDIQKSFYISVLGCLILFFSIILDDVIGKYTLYYTYLFTLFFSYFPLLLFFRLLLSSRTHQLIQEKKIGFNTLLIGNGNKANSIYHDLENEKPT
ncbi:MAG: hypothetical protein RR328_05920, partial [Bacteroidales bacterium]